MKRSDHIFTGFLAVCILCIGPLLFSSFTRNVLLVKETFYPVAAALGCWGLAANGPGGKMYKHGTVVFLMFLSFLVSALGAYNVAAALRFSLIFSLGPLVAILVARVGVTEKFLFRMVFLGVLIAATNAFFHICNVKGITLGGFSVKSGLGNPNVLSHYLELMLPLGIWLSYEFVTRRRLVLSLILVACSGLMLYTIILASTRGALLGLALGVPSAGIFILIPRLSRSFRYMAALVALVVVILGLFAGPALLEKPVARMMREDFNVKVRLLVYRDTMEMFRDHFVFGVGGGNFPEQYRYYRNTWDDGSDPKLSRITVMKAHNDYLQTAAETGVTGLLLFYGMIISLLVRAARLRGSRFTFFAIVGLAATLVDSFFNFNFRVPVSYWSFFLILGFANGVQSRPGSIRMDKFRLLLAMTAAGVLSLCASREYIALGEYSLGKGFQNNNRFEESLKHYQAGYEIDESSTFFVFQKGLVEEELGFTEKAVSTYLAIRKIDPFYENVLNHLGSISFNRGDYSAAIRWYWIVHRIKPGLFEPFSNIVSSIYKQLGGEYSSVWFWKGMERYQPGEDFITNAMKIEYLQGNYLRLKKMVERLVVLDRLSPAHLSLALSYASREKDEKFHKELIDRVTRRTPEKTGTFASNLMKNAQYREAIELLKDVEEGDLLLLRARAWFNLSRLRKSEQDYASALGNGAEPDVEDRLKIGQIYLNQERFKEALQQFDRVIEQLPDDPVAWYFKGLCELKLQDPGFRKSLERSLELIKNRPNSRIEHSIRKILGIGGRPR